jgi:hypothetical protein
MYVNIKKKTQYFNNFMSICQNMSKHVNILCRYVKTCEIDAELAITHKSAQDQGKGLVDIRY